MSNYHLRDKGYFEYDYLIYEIPHFIREENVKKYPDVEEPIQINTNIINTKKQIDKDDKTQISSFFVAEERNILILELINREFINETDTQIFYYDKLFEEFLEHLIIMKNTTI